MDSGLIFDTLDLDLLVKVLSRTVFSPFFTFFIPLLYKAQGANWDDTIVLQSGAWCAFTVVFWLIRFSSQIWRNGGSFLLSPPRFDWGEQIVLITGGASGVGALLANTLAVRNVSVVVLDVKPLITENYNIYSYICDVSNWADLLAARKKIAEEVGNPTVIINNAGVVQGKLLLDLTSEDLQQTFGVNVIAQFLVLKAFLPDMIKQNAGHVITMGSVLGEVGVSQLSDYCASKAALISLNESLRYELDKRYKTPNVRTTLVLPGQIATSMFAGVSFAHSWMKLVTPVLPAHAVAKAIIAAMDSQFSTTIRLPFYVHLTPWLRLTPSYIRDWFQWVSGADEGMKGFVKP